MKEFSLSIIIPVYNGYKYMLKCLDSLENQTIKPDEIIIGDDCSTDDTYEQLLKYKEKSSLNIVLFKNEKNGGPGYTRNVAKKMATSVYLAFCDADDWYELNFVETMRDCAVSECPDLIVFDNYTVIDGKQKVAGTTYNMIGRDKNVALALYPMSLCRFVASAAIVDTIDFPPLYNGEDGAVAPQIIAKSDKTVVIDQPFYNYLYRQDSASMRPSPKVYRGLLDAFDIVKDKLRDEYPSEVEFIGIKSVYYGAVLNAMKAKTSRCIICDFIDDFKLDFPNWNKNIYFQDYSFFKRAFVWSASYKFFLLLKPMTMVHSILTR